MVVNSLLILVIAAAVSAAIIVAFKPVLARYAVARPNARSSHTQPTPQGGGIAVVVATILAVLVGAALPGTGAIAGLWPLVAAVLLLAMTGACDDIFHLSKPILPAARDSRRIERCHIKLNPGGGEIDAHPVDQPAALLGYCKPLTTVRNACENLDRLLGVTLLPKVPVEQDTQPE